MEGNSPCDSSTEVARSRADFPVLSLAPPPDQLLTQAEALDLGVSRRQLLRARVAGRVRVYTRGEDSRDYYAKSEVLALRADTPAYVVGYWETIAHALRLDRLTGALAKTG